MSSNSCDKDDCTKCCCTEPTGTTVNAINTSLSISVTPQTKILLVYSVTTSGLSLATAVAGYASTGITIN